MKLLLLTCFAMITLAITTYAQNLTPISLESSAPKNELKMKDVSGKAVSLKDAMGKNGLLVMFSCNTCPYVVKNQERTKEVCQYALQNGFGVIIINSNEDLRNEDDSYDAMKAYAKTQGYNWSYVVDKNSELANAFGATRTPEVFLFNNNNKLVYHGAIDDSPADAANVKREHLKEAIADINAGKEISVKQSKSVGCSIKRVM